MGIFSDYRALGMMASSDGDPADAQEPTAVLGQT